MGKLEKILVILVIGSLWGALELFGRDIMRAMGVPQKSALLFGLGIIILYASKKLVDFPGSVTIMAVIAGLFKMASSYFFPCQFSAVVINGIVFDITYLAFKDRLDASMVFRAIAAPVIVYVSYATFALFATYLLREGSWVERGWEGVVSYVRYDALTAALITIVTIHLGYSLARAVKPLAQPRTTRMPAMAFRVISVALVAVIWVAGQWFVN
ncbi:MAG: hypothetical protein GYA46_02050 [candidate division Zixibacteria bacterium]|nr:hypothetical protein [candidate division Zixibacteria bacterium]